ATPVAIMVGNGMGAKHGILFKTAVSLEETGKVEIVALDKTGTITSGEPRVTDILPAEGMDETGLLQLAYALEQKSEHPLAKAILSQAQEKGLQAEEVTDFQALPGNGLKAVWKGTTLHGGNLKYISTQATVPASMQSAAEKLAEAGKTPLFFSQDGQLVGIIAVADVIKEDSPRAVKELQNMGIRVVMLTGDNERTAKAIGAQAGVDQVIAGVLPDGKESVIRRLKNQGKVAMVGDGINDAPALTRADIGIAIGAGTDVAIDAADVVLMKSRLSDVPAAIRLSRATLRTIHQNLFWAFFYNSIGIPLAAGVFIPLLHWQMNPMFGAAAMSLSSFCVVTNALRLNLFDLRDASKDKKIKQKEKEQKIMEKTMKIEGMMCPHCEARVKKTLEAMEQVEAAEVSYQAGTAIVTLKEEVCDEVLKKTIEEQGYPVLSIQ
ncbi:MAG: heavy metal translocating P-type ATPase, partial [Lachnospiraceae bacterium]|nr:heavy metal translocating P-type ATPase [Lachnospiraceae bacterium]